MSVTIKQNNLPPLRGRLRKMGSKILPHIKGQLSARPADTFKAQKVRGEDVQVVLKFLQESFDLAPMTTPADTVCKLRLKMSNTDNKIKWMKEQLMDHDVLLLGVQEELDLGPEVNAVRTARAFKKYIRTSKEHTAHLEKTIKENEALLKTCKEIAGVSRHHTPDGLANFFRSTWIRQRYVISQLKNNIQELKKDSKAQLEESILDLAREMDVDTSSSHISTIFADMTGKFMAMKNDVTSLNDMVKVKKEEIKTFQDLEKTKTNRIVELENELDNLKTRNNYLTLDLKQAQEERKSATNLVSDLEHKLDVLQIDNDRKALEIEGLLQRYEDAGKVVTNLQSELDDTKQLNQFLNLQIKALDNAKENDAADWEQQKKDLESKLENLKEEIENLNQTNEKLRKEAKSVESQDDWLFEELEKNMELCQDLEDKVTTAALEKAEFEQETSRWENEKSELLIQLQSVQKQYQALEDDFDVLHEEKVDFQSLADSLAEANYNLSAEIGQAYKDMHALDDKLTSMEEEGEKQQELANMLKEENNTLSTSLTSIRNRCKNLEEEIENLNQTNEKLRKEAKSLESQDDGLFEELEKNMELCQDLEDKVATAAREKAEFEQETSRWENEKSELLKQLQNVQKQYQILNDQFNSVTQDGEQRHKLASNLIEEKEELCTQLEEKRQQCEINIEDPLLERGDSALEKSHGEREKIDLKEMVEDLQYKTCKQESLIKKLRYHLSKFHKKALKEKDSMYDNIAYVDRAVVDQIYSDKELTIIKAEDLSCVPDADVDEEDDLIGKGAFGKVFLRQYQSEAVAVKVPYISDGARDEDDEKRLFRIKADHAHTTMEAQVHLAFADHPSFPKTVSIVDFEGVPSLVLEFFGDKKTGTTYSLSQAIKFQIPDLSKSNWFDIIMYIINGTKVMHEKGLLHNDLKSNNILQQWDPDDQRWHAFIIDMGKVSTQIIPLRHNKVPKEEIQGYKDGILFQHLAPEYILDLQPMTVQTDIYSLGKLLGRIEKVVKSRGLRDLVAEMTNVKPRLRPSWKHIERVIAKAQKRNLS